MSTNQLVKELRNANEDYEFYPTTNEQLDAINEDIQEILKTHYFNTDKTVKILDVGAGDGRSLISLGECLSSLNNKPTLFAVEKSNIHIRSYLNKEISVIGTDFHQTNFISKQSDLVFTNPPYLEFEKWVYTLIKQLKFKLMYAVIPERWEERGMIKEALERMSISYEIIQKSDFTSADRPSRAKVHVVRFFHENKKLKRVLGNRKHPLGISQVSPFQVFINDELGIKANKSAKMTEFSKISKQTKEEKNEVIQKKGVLETLLDGYDKDMTRVLEDYKKIASIDPQLLNELGVKHDSLVSGLEEKLLGFRDVYWKLLFDHLDVLYKKLTQKNKTSLLNTLNANSLDFTYNNAIYIIDYAVTIANDLIEDSIIHVYKNLTSEKSILRHYKSNEHVYRDDWRYNGNPDAKYVLDYRFISSHFHNFSSYSWEKGLIDNAREFTNDLVVAMSLIGYNNVEIDKSYDEIEAGGVINIKSGDLVLVNIKYYQNGNRHIKFNPEAMLRFNTVAARVLGWVRSKEDFSEETDINNVSNEIWSLSDTMKIQTSQVLGITHK